MAIHCVDCNRIGALRGRSACRDPQQRAGRVVGEETKRAPRTRNPSAGWVGVRCIETPRGIYGLLPEEHTTAFARPWQVVLASFCCPSDRLSGETRGRLSPIIGSQTRISFS